MLPFLMRCLLGVPKYQIAVEGETLDGHTVRLLYETHKNIMQQDLTSQRRLARNKLEKWHCTHLKTNSIRLVALEKQNDNKST